MAFISALSLSLGIGLDALFSLGGNDVTEQLTFNGNPLTFNSNPLEFDNG